MYSTTGFSREQILNLCVLLNDTGEFTAKPTGRRPALGLYRAVVLTLSFVRRARVQQELAENFGVSQSTVSRVITRLTPVLGAVLEDWVPVVEELDPDRPLILDGTLVPCWSWDQHPQLFSGKHRTTGVNLQVLCDLSGSLVWVSDPVAGRTHDVAAVRESGLLEHLHPSRVLGDKGYIGLGMLTPIRKPAHRELVKSEKEYNRSINQIRYVVERTIANLKTWRVLHTDYRRPLNTFPDTITAVIALEFYRNSFE